MRGCSVAILVLNVLDDSVCQLKDKEGRSLDYSVTSGTVHRFLSLSLFLSPPFSLSNTHTHTFHLSCSIFLFLTLTHTLSHTHTHTHLSCAMVRIPSKSSVIYWYRAPSTGPMCTISDATQISHLLLLKDTNSNDCDV